MTIARRSLLRRVSGVFLAVALAILIADPGTVEAAGSRRSTRTASSTSTSATPSKLTLAKLKAAGSRTAATRARRSTAGAAQALREAKEPHFKFDESGALVPDIRAEAAIIYNPRTGDVLWEQNSTAERSIASITKVMTAAVVLESPEDLATSVTISRADVLRANTTYIRAGDQVTKDDLLHLMLIGSDNAAARVLAKTSPLGYDGFISRMNAKAREYGLKSTTYVDPAGIFAANVSNAYDMARLITIASDNERMASIMRTSSYSVSAVNRNITVNSTNQLVKAGDVDVQAGKTGFIRTAGYCLATLLRLPQGGGEVAVVVLGARSNAGRFWETRHLLNWFSAKAEDLLGGRVEAAAAALGSAASAAQ
jgi:D-alanyl-D-alanine endopeptidase (penicillin-binding protein 7)